MSTTTPDGKTILLTGAASGLGHAMALGLLDAGARVVLTDFNPELLEAARAQVAAFGERAVLVRADLTRPDEVRSLLQTVDEQIGAIDVLVNNAGINPAAVRRDFGRRPVRFWEHDEATTRRFFELNAIAPFILCKHMAEAMMARKWGRIINVTTSLNTMLSPGAAGYGGTKAALEAHTATMAADLAGTGVTANVLLPGGPADTPMIPEEAGYDRSTLIQPSAMVAPILWLASDASGDVTGRRFLAAKWDPALPSEAAAQAAGAPIGWPQPA